MWAYRVGGGIKGLNPLCEAPSPVWSSVLIGRKSGDSICCPRRGQSVDAAWGCSWQASHGRGAAQLRRAARRGPTRSEVDHADLAILHVRGLGAAAHLLKVPPVAAVAHSHNNFLRLLLKPAAEGTNARLQEGKGG